MFILLPVVFFKHVFVFFMPSSPHLATSTQTRNRRPIRGLLRRSLNQPMIALPPLLRPLLPLMPLLLLLLLLWCSPRPLKPRLRRWRVTR